MPLVVVLLTTVVDQLNRETVDYFVRNSLRETVSHPSKLYCRDIHGLEPMDMVMLVISIFTCTEIREINEAVSF